LERTFTGRSVSKLCAMAHSTLAPVVASPEPSWSGCPINFRKTRL
jgi:hypothetical protein